MDEEAIDAVLDSVASLSDWEVATAMEAAHLAVALWEPPFDSVSTLATPEPRTSGSDMGDAWHNELAIVLAARLFMEAEETAALNDLVGELVQDALRSVYARLDDEESCSRGSEEDAAGAGDGSDADSESDMAEALDECVHHLVEDAIAHVLAHLAV
jgi:hypothetical protein